MSTTKLEARHRGSRVVGLRVSGRRVLGCGLKVLRFRVRVVGFVVEGFGFRA